MNTSTNKLQEKFEEGYSDGYFDGQWTAYDEVLSIFNSVDTTDMSGNEVRSAFYEAVLGLRPRKATNES